ncbi:MAG TPA: hypothetical protein VMW04_02705 [Patescibacteria group bacterium]|nr:hypothetical protein [Patescibacteria group bacterium]
MARKIRVAFDLDGVIVDKPPLIPQRLIDRLFKGGNQRELRYRFPRFKLEKYLRKISHYYLFRPPIGNNIALIRRLAREKEYELFVISGRYSFLKDETKNWLKKRELEDLFAEVFVNLGDEQPHLFKERMLRKIKADIFVEDDEEIASFLKEKLSSLKVVCPSNKKIEISSICN